jgi:hypothetical protein
MDETVSRVTAHATTWSERTAFRWNLRVAREGVVAAVRFSAERSAIYAWGTSGACFDH